MSEIMFLTSAIADKRLNNGYYWIELNGEWGPAEISIDSNFQSSTIRHINTNGLIPFYDAPKDAQICVDRIKYPEGEEDA